LAPPLRSTFCHFKRVIRSIITGKEQVFIYAKKYIELILLGQKTQPVALTRAYYQLRSPFVVAPREARNGNGGPPP
jgi:hypothetical protein